MKRVRSIFGIFTVFLLIILASFLLLAEHGKFESIFDSDGTASDKICSNASGTKGERD